MRREASPADRAGEAELIENLGRVAGDAALQDLPLPGIRRRLETLELAEDFQHAALAGQLRAGSEVLPAQ